MVVMRMKARYGFVVYREFPMVELGARLTRVNKLAVVKLANN